MNIEQAKEIRSSLLWTAVLEELDARIKNEEAKLRTCLADQLRVIQIKIAVLEEMKRLPDDVVSREE